MTVAKLVAQYINIDRFKRHANLKPTWSSNWADPRGRRSNIDATFSTGGIGEKIKEWTVSEEIQESDHKAISFAITAEKPKPTM